MKWHESFRDQSMECKKTGNRFLIEVPDARGFYVSVPACAVIVCVQFKTYCHSKACREMRIGLQPENQTLGYMKTVDGILIDKKF